MKNSQLSSPFSISFKEIPSFVFHSVSQQIGLKDIHIAVLTKDDAIEVTYGIPSKLERAVSAQVTPPYPLTQTIRWRM